MVLSLKKIRKREASQVTESKSAAKRSGKMGVWLGGVMFDSC